MVQGDLLSAVAKRRRLNGGTASASPSPGPVVSEQALSSLCHQSLSQSNDNSFAALANHGLADVPPYGGELTVETPTLVAVTLSKGEKAFISGAYLLRMRQGAILFQGTEFRCDGSKPMVFAPDTYETAPIICLTTMAVFELQNMTRTMPDFLGFESSYSWSSGDGLFMYRTFYVHDPETRPFCKVKPAKELDHAPTQSISKAISEFNPAVAGRMLSIVLGGVRTPGVSAHTRTILNHLIDLKDAQGFRRYRSGILCLDLDLHNPELGVPGTVSLIHVKGPILSPAFTHPATPRTNNVRLIAMEFLGVPESAVAKQYVFDQLATLAYKKHVDMKCPLVVKAWDWFSDMPSLKLHYVASSLLPTHVIAFRSAQSSVIDMFTRQLAAAALAPLTDIALGNIQEPPLAEQHSRLTQSYFHICRVDGTRGYHWFDRPVADDISSIVQLPYGQLSAPVNITAIRFEDWIPEADDLITSLRGRIVAIVPVLNSDEDEQAASQEANTTPLSSSPNTGSLRLTTTDVFSAQRSSLLALGIVHDIDVVSQSISLWTPPCQRDFQRLEGRGSQVHLIVVRPDAEGRFSTDWMHKEIEDKRRTDGLKKRPGQV